MQYRDLNNNKGKLLLTTNENINIKNKLQILNEFKCKKDCIYFDLIT